MRKVGLLAILVLSGCVNDHPAVRPLRPLEIATAPYQPLVSFLLGSATLNLSASSTVPIAH